MLDSISLQPFSSDIVSLHTHAHTLWSDENTITPPKAWLSLGFSVYAVTKLPEHSFFVLNSFVFLLLEKKTLCKKGSE